MQNASLEIRQLSKNYGSREALRELSLTVPPGQILGFLDPNGAGKSTTISILSGFLTPTSGDVLWNGQSIFTRIAEWRRQIGLVMEDLSLFEYLTVAEHLRLIGHLMNLGAGETERRTGELLEFLDLREHAETAAAEASHGTRKKLALALAILHSPRVLLLDEATNGIDAVTVSRIKTLLRRLAAGGVTIIISSHVLDSIEAIVDRCVIINKGRLCLDRPLSEIRGTGRSLEQVYTSTIVGPDAHTPELSWVR